MLSQHFPDLDFSREIVTAYYRQLSSDFSMNSRPIHIDSAKVGCGEVQVIWAEYDREWSKDGSGFKSGARYEVRIPYAFWMAHQASLELEQYLDLQIDPVLTAA